LSKEESDKTAEFLLSKPVKRNTVVTAKLLNVFFYIFSFNFALSLGSYISCEIVKRDKFSIDTFILLCVGALLVQLMFAAVGFLISVFVVKTKSVTPIAIGVVLGTYFLNSLAGMTEKTENFKYLTPFKYVDARDILTDKSLNPVYLLIISAVIVVSIVMTYVFYNRKDIRN
jgi:ABC-2 type transport system permease protein